MNDNRFKPYMFSKTADFGTTKSVTNGAGVSIPKFIKSFTLHYYQKQKTITQKYLALSTSYEDSIILVVRHDARVNDSLLVQLNGVTYNIIDISSDDTNYISYDFITVTKSKKVGG